MQTVSLVKMRKSIENYYKSFNRNEMRQHREMASVLN